jgi:hypothetical protein
VFDVKILPTPHGLVDRAQLGEEKNNIRSESSQVLERE